MLVWLSVWATQAVAQQEVCDAMLTPAEWRQAMDAVDDALIGLDGARAERILDDVLTELRCLDALAEPSDLGRLARQVSLIAFWQQDHEELVVWALLARKTLGGAAWPEAVPAPDRYFDLLDELVLLEPMRVDGAGLAVPDGGGALVDGWLVRLPESELSVQHFAQIADGDGQVVWGGWIDGTRWPEEWLDDLAEPTSMPTWYEAPPTPIPWASPGGDLPMGGDPPPIEGPEPMEPEPVEPEPVELVEGPAVVAQPAPRPPGVSDATANKLAMIERRKAQRAARRPSAAVTFDGDGRDANCLWKNQPKNVDASRREVAVNRHRFAITTDAERATFNKVLRDCGEFRAARKFTQWQDRRGLFAGGGTHRDAMLAALVAEEPSRKKGS